MISKASANFVVFAIYPKQYLDPPRDIRCCPSCRGSLSKSNISPSKAVTSWLATATIPFHGFSCLYKCPGCQWWAVWEVFGDAEYSPDFNYLLTSRHDSTSESRHEPWKIALEDEHAYEYEALLPQSLEQVLVGGKKRILDLPKAGDKVRLVGDVHMLRDPEAVPFELVALFIAGSEGVVASDEELYDLIPGRPVGPDAARNLLIRLKAHIHAKNCCPIRLEKLVIPQGHHNRHACKPGNLYLIDAADVQKIQ